MGCRKHKDRCTLPVQATRLAAVSPHLCRRHNSRVSQQPWLPEFLVSAAANVCTGCRDLSKVNPQELIGSRASIPVTADGRSRRQ